MEIGLTEQTPLSSPVAPSPATLTPAILSRHLMRRMGKAALATIDRDDGKPYASLVVYAALADASPVMLLSDLADHSKNIMQESACSLMIDGASGEGATGSESLSGSRLTVQGRISAVEDDAALKQRIITRHPEAAIYADFTDFKTYHITPERMHLIGGFGMIHWIDAADVLADAPDLDAAATDIIDHMNDDHADAVAIYAVQAGMASDTADADGWRMTGIDTDGIDLSDGNHFCRINTDQRMHTPGDARRVLAALSKQGV